MVYVGARNVVSETSDTEVSVKDPVSTSNQDVFVAMDFLISMQIN